MKILNLTFILTFVFCSRLLAASGKTGAEFLLLDLSAKSAALAGAQSASLQAQALQGSANPASLAYLLTQKEVSFAHIRRPLEVSYNQAAYAQKLNFFDSVAAINIVYGNSGDIEETLVDVGRDQGRKTGTSFDASDLSVSLSAAKNFTESYSVGLSARFLRQTIADASAQGAAADFGMIYKSADIPFSLGISLKNLGSLSRFNSASLELPLVFNAGASAQFLSKKLLSSLEIEKIRDQDAALKAAIEYKIQDIFSLRAGQKDFSNAQENFTFGAGAKWKNYLLDYAVGLENLGQSHHITLTLQW